GGGGIKRLRCLAEGCGSSVARGVAFCSEDCAVSARRQAVKGILAHRSASEKGKRNKTPPAKATTTITAKKGAGKSGDGAEAGAGAGGRQGGVKGKERVVGSAPSTPSSHHEDGDEEEFDKGLEAMLKLATAPQRFRFKVRDRFGSLFQEGMAELGLPRDLARCMVLAWDLENELQAFAGADRSLYKERAQSLRFNVRLAKNPELFKDILTGETSMRKLCQMSAEDLASSRLKEERKRIRDEGVAGHLRQEGEGEGDELVYKDGAFQKVASVKSDAKRAFLAGGDTASSASSKSPVGGAAEGGKGGERTEAIE
ncbi:unnamed protein product, partial [Discosporangium mesarthrocarpum]